jgi:8-oxo-dGTP diphosphatase
MRSQSVAVGVAFDADGHVLLVRTTYGERSYGPPGGRIEAGESPAAAVRREFKEETGLDVAVERLIGFYSFTDEDHETRAYAFLCAIVGGELRLPRDEISEVLWADPQGLPEPADMVGPFAIADAASAKLGRRS